MDTSKVTRIEVIDHTKSVEEGGGRIVLLNQNVPNAHVELQLQDEGRTLKIFIQKP